MKTYSYSKAREVLARLLDEAADAGEVRIRRRDGREFSVRPVQGINSPLDIESIDLGITTSEIVELIREGREHV